MRVNKVLAGALGATLLLAAVGCSSGTSATTGSSSGSSTIKIGIKFDQPGLGLKDGSTYTGMDVDVAKYVAGKLGYTESQIEWVQSPSAQRETLIANGQVKYIVATYSITDERKQKVDFAGPYFIAGQDLLVRSDDSTITDVSSLAGKSLCSVTGSTSAQNVKAKVPDVNLQEFGTYSECVAALTTGGIDALTTDNTILAGYASQAQYAGKLKLVGKPFSEEKYGIGLKKGDTALCNQITDAIKSMVSDGTWQTIVTKNLGGAGFTPDAKSNPPTPAACS